MGAMHLPSRRLLAMAVVSMTSLALVACGSSVASEIATTTSVPEVQIPDPVSEAALFASQEPNWVAISEDIDLVLATPDLGVGEQRFGIVLSDDKGLIKFPIVKLTSNYFPDGYNAEPNLELSDSGSARFYEFPFGTRGIYSTNLKFAKAGLWSVSANVPRPDGSSSRVEVRFPVAETAMSVAVGQNAPLSDSRTLADTGDLAGLTTGSLRDPGLYEYSIADAIDRDRPLLIVFASPAFCTNAVCGPQVEVASELREEYGEQVDFVHVDLYTNTQEIQGDLSKAQLTPILAEWGLTSQEWTFIVGPDGVVTHRFENFAPKPELIVALDQAIEMS